jgi:hypothetical protein
MIEVKKKSSKEFLVRVSEKDSRTEHAVTLDDGYHESLTKGKITKEELIKRSFEFLLERESKESILSKFDLRIISNYFPEFEAKISSNLKK